MIPSLVWMARTSANTSAREGGSPPRVSGSWPYHQPLATAAGKLAQELRSQLVMTNSLAQVLRCAWLLSRSAGRRSRPADDYGAQQGRLYAPSRGERRDNVDVFIALRAES